MRTRQNPLLEINGNHSKLSRNTVSSIPFEWRLIGFSANSRFDLVRHALYADAVFTSSITKTTTITERR